MAPHHPHGPATVPQITSHPANGTVHARVLLVTGTCGAASGNLWVTAHHYTFPPQSFPVARGRFKALLHLSPGENILQLAFTDGATNATETTVWTTTYIPLLQNPPLHLAILVASDSAEQYDDVPSPPEPNNLETAKKRLRMAGYLWQAYTEAEMARQGLGHRTFRLDERWEPDTLSRVDTPYRQTAHIHVLRSKYNTAHIRDPSRAQQNAAAGAAGDLYGIAMEAVRDAFTGPSTHIAVLILDATGKGGDIIGHAALGGGTDQHHVAIFGSHSVFAWPSNLEAVVPAFNDTRPVDRKHCGVDCEGSSYWMAANVGLGAMLHEVGHALGCPHERTGVMLRDYVRWNRSFSAIEPTTEDLRVAPECAWHRLDALRFRCHAAFTLPGDENVKGHVNCLGVDGGIEIATAAGILFITLRSKSSAEEFPDTWLEWPDAAQAPRAFLLTPKYLMDKVDRNPENVEIGVWSTTGAQLDVRDLAPMLRPARDPDLGLVYRTAKFGTMDGDAAAVALPYQLGAVRVHCGAALDGIEFFAPGARDGLLFGKRGGSPHDFVLRPGEHLVGLSVRSGGWLDAVQLVLSSGRRSDWFGGPGGGRRDVMLPRGYRLCGVWGEVAGWIMGLGLSYCRA